MIGTGIKDGPHRPDFGAGWANLTCDTCGATWVGPIGETCEWCATDQENQQRWQAEKLLAPELPDPADVRYPASFLAWGERLARAVTAGLVTKTQAADTYRRHAPRDAA